MKETAMLGRKSGDGDEVPPPPPPGECPQGNRHNWARSGHDYVCTKCGARVPAL